MNCGDLLFNIRVDIQYFQVYRGDLLTEDILHKGTPVGERQSGTRVYSKTIIF